MEERADSDKCVAVRAGVAPKVRGGTWEAEPPGRVAEAVMTHGCGATWETALAAAAWCEQGPGLGLPEWLWWR